MFFNFPNIMQGTGELFWAIMGIVGICTVAYTLIKAKNK